MDTLRATLNVATILASPEQRARWEYDAAAAEAAVRSARRQVQRYGYAARAQYLRQASSEEERALIERALSTARVRTVVFEWLARG